MRLSLFNWAEQNSTSINPQTEDVYVDCAKLKKWLDIKISRFFYTKLIAGFFPMSEIKQSLI